MFKKYVVIFLLPIMFNFHVNELTKVDIKICKVKYFKSINGQTNLFT